LAALRRFNDGVAIIVHAIWQYSMLVSQDSAQHFIDDLQWLQQSFDWVEHSWKLEALLSKTGKYRKRLELNSALSQLVRDEGSKEPDLKHISAFFSKPRYNHFLLDIGRWLMNKGWRKSGDHNWSVESQGTLQLLSCEMLSSGWNSLLQSLAKQRALSVSDYIEHHAQLKRSLLTGSCVGGLYSESIRNDFRMPWLDLSSGIDELKTLDLLRSLAQQLDGAESIATLSWLDQQTDSLLHAMEQSRQLAAKMKPYWTKVA
jgi:triphosphatase